MASPIGTPAQGRDLRAQGRRTMRSLLDAGIHVFAERGYQAARVDDIVRAARTSHGTFYLYFTNKDDLLRALAVDCAETLGGLADDVGPIGRDDEGYAELHRFLGDFHDVYRCYGPVIRAWMEGQVADREVDRLGVRAFTAVASMLGRRMVEAGPSRRADGGLAAGALIAMLERFNYAVSSRAGAPDRAVMLDTLTRVVHRGFFGAPASVPGA